MRKLKLQVQVSVDGFIAGPGAEMDWLTFDWDDGLKAYVTQITEPVDTILLGRKLAEGFIPHWASHPEMEGAEKFNTARKIVFTRTLERSPWERATLATGDLIEEVQRLKAQEGGDLIVYGGGTFVSDLIRHGLIDEYHLFVNPVVLGDGMPIFRGRQTWQALTLEQATAFACGIVALRYTPAT